jgi:hypothetical protein
VRSRTSALSLSDSHIYTHSARPPQHGSPVRLLRLSWSIIKKFLHGQSPTHDAHRSSYHTYLSRLLQLRTIQAIGFVLPVMQLPSSTKESNTSRASSRPQKKCVQCRNGGYSAVRTIGIDFRTRSVHEIVRAWISLLCRMRR